MKRKWREPQHPIATFAQLLVSGEKWLWVHCNNHLCHHSVAVPLVPFAIRWGMNVPAATVIREAFQCSRCGDKTSTITTPSVVAGTGGVQVYPLERGLRVPGN
jgi:hypothetical protein